MWIHRRIGLNSGVTFSPFAVGLLLLAACLLLTTVWPLALVIAGVGVVCALDPGGKKQHATYHQHLCLPSCRYCQSELTALRDREHREAAQSDLDRLRRKYRDAS